MYKKLLLAVFAAAMLLPAALQADEYTTMKDIMLDLAEYVVLLEDSLNQEIVHLHADIITTDGVSYSRTLRAGWTYGVTAFGDWRIADLDVIIYKDVDGQWIEIERDEAEDSNPTVMVQPSSDGTYSIDISVYSFSGDYSAAHYGLVIFHEMPE
jgi:hypothetical protein